MKIHNKSLKKQQTFISNRVPLICRGETDHLVKEIQESAERRIQSIKEYYEWEINKLKNGNVETTATTDEPTQNNSELEMLREKVRCLESELSKKDDKCVPVVSILKFGSHFFMLFVRLYAIFWGGSFQTRESWSRLMGMQKELMEKKETIEVVSRFLIFLSRELIDPR